MLEKIRDHQPSTNSLGDRTRTANCVVTDLLWYHSFGGSQHLFGEEQHHTPNTLLLQMLGVLCLDPSARPPPLLEVIVGVLVQEEEHKMLASVTSLLAVLVGCSAFNVGKCLCNRHHIHPLGIAISNHRSSRQSDAYSNSYSPVSSD